MDAITWGIFIGTGKDRIQIATVDTPRNASVADALAAAKQKLGRPSSSIDVGLPVIERRTP